MRTCSLLFFLLLSTIVLASPQVQVIPSPKGLEDFEHQFKGCPENSECDQVMGLQMQRWKDLVSKLKKEEMPKEKKALFLDLFLSKYGIPAEFYTTKKSQQGFRPLYFNSPCKNHNPKDPEKKVLKGIAFIKSLGPLKATVWRDQTQIEVPLGELLNPQPVKVYYPEGVQTYYLSLGDQPLYIKGHELHVLKEDDELFYGLKVNKEGVWKIEAMDFDQLSSWDDKRQNAECPKDKDKAPKEFENEFCKTVWDMDSKKTVVVKMYQGCFI